MSKCFSITASISWCYRSTFSTSGLRSQITDLGDGTVIHCWVPKTRKPNKPDLLLIHGFGAHATWQWRGIIRLIVPHFNVYVPDLVFFGDSYTTRPDRSESFQARCVMRVMEENRVEKMSLVGLSYGGFVAYSIAVQYPDKVDRVIVCSAGVCLEEKDLTEGLFPVSDLEEAADILLPQNAEKMRELMGYTFVKPPNVTPSCFLQDFIDEMFVEHREGKKQLIWALAKDRKLSDLPKILQPTLIVWGDGDQIFPLELGHRLKRLEEGGGMPLHPTQGLDTLIEENMFLSETAQTNSENYAQNLFGSFRTKITQPQLACPPHTCKDAGTEWHLGENAELVVIKNTGHAFMIEKPKEVYKLFKSFLIDNSSSK